MSNKVSLKIDESEKKKRLLRSLQRKNDMIVDIIADCNQVTLYDFDFQNKKWAESDIAGSLHITNSYAAPYFQMIVLNRQNPEDYALDLSLLKHVAKQGEKFVALRYLPENAAPKIVGLWFSTDEEANGVMESIESVKAELDAGYSPPVPTLDNGSSSSSSASKTDVLKGLLLGGVKKEAAPNTVFNAPSASPADALKSLLSIPTTGKNSEGNSKKKKKSKKKNGTESSERDSVDTDSATAALKGLLLKPIGQSIEPASAPAVNAVASSLLMAMVKGGGETSNGEDKSKRKEEVVEALSPPKKKDLTVVTPKSPPSSSLIGFLSPSDLKTP